MENSSVRPYGCALESVEEMYSYEYRIKRWIWRTKYGLHVVAAEKKKKKKKKKGKKKRDPSSVQRSLIIRDGEAGGIRLGGGRPLSMLM